MRAGPRGVSLRDSSGHLAGDIRVFPVVRIMSGRALSLCLLAAIVIGLLLTVAMMRWADERQRRPVRIAAPIGAFVQAPGAEAFQAELVRKAAEVRKLAWVEMEASKEAVQREAQSNGDRLRARQEAFQRDAEARQQAIQRDARSHDERRRELEAFGVLARSLERLANGTCANRILCPEGAGTR